MAGKKQTSVKTARPKREQVESKEEAIVAAAYEMIAAQGFSKTTISEIAKAAGVADGTLYLYFNNKEALANGVLDAFYKQLTESAQHGVEKRQSTRNQLEFLARHHLTNIIEKRRILEMLFVLDRSPENYDGSEIYQMNRAYVAVFDGVVREGVYRGDIGEHLTPWILRDIFFGTLEYAMRTMLIKGRQKNTGAVVRELVDLITTKPAERIEKLNDQDLTKITRRLEMTADRIERSLTAKSGANS